MRKLWASLVLAVLLISSFPVGLADEPAEPTRTTHSFECDIGQLTHEEVKTLYEEVYSKGYQSRVEVSPSPTHSLEQNVKEVLQRTPQQIIDEHNNRTNPNANNSKVGEMEIATPDGRRKFDYTRGCVSCELFPFTSGTDTPYFACSKGLTTRVSYCEKGVDKCAENVTNKTDISGLFGRLGGPGHDNLMAIDDFKFYQRNGAYAPTDYNSLIYSQAQKTYDNWLPVSTIASLFIVPQFLTLGKIKAKGGEAIHWLRKLWKTPAQKKLLDLKYAAKHASKGSVLHATSPTVAKSFGGVDDALRGGGAIPVSGIGSIDDLQRTMGPLVDDLTRTGEAFTSATGLKVTGEELAGWTPDALGTVMKNLHKEHGPEAALTALQQYQRAVGDLGALRQAQRAVLTSFEEGVTTGGGTLGYLLASSRGNPDVVLPYLKSVGMDPDVARPLLGYTATTGTGGVVTWTAPALPVAGTAAGTQAAVLGTSAEEGLKLSTQATSMARKTGYISAAQEGALLKLGRVLSGRTKSMTWRVIMRGVVIHNLASAPGANTVGAHQIVFSVSQAAKGKGNIKEHLDGVPPYIDILTQDSAHLGGFEAILSYIGIPEIVNQWVSLLQWRFSGDTSQRPPDVEMDIKCRDDSNSVKDTAWTFRSGSHDKTFVIGDGTLSMHLSGNVLVVKSDGKAHSYTTEVEDVEGCLPTIITKTHGVDIKSQVWKSKGLTVEGLSNLMKDLSGTGGGGSEIEEKGRGLLFEDYLSPKGEYERCASTFDLTDPLQSAGFYLLAQTIPIVDIATMPFAAYHMATCLDTDYYVHMTVNSEQSGTQILEDLFSFGETEEAKNATGGGGTPAPTPTTPTPAGGAVAVEGEVTQRTREGASPTGAVSGSLVIGEDDEEESVSYQGSMEGMLNKIVDIGVVGKDFAERSLREQEVKRLNKRTFWFRGQYAKGFYGALKVENCCYIYFTGNSVQLPMDTKVKERAMVDNLAPGKDKTVVKITKEADGTPTLEIEKVKEDGKKRTVLKKTDDMLRQTVDTPKTGTIIPKKVTEIIYDPSSKDVLFRSTLGGPSSTAEVRGGDLGSEKVKEILKCITDYINGALMKHYSDLEFDRALAELGEINRVILDSGVQIEKKGERFILANPSGISTGSNLEIRVDRTVLLDGVELDKVKIIHTEKGQFMWLAEKNKLLVWLYKTGEGKGSKFEIDEEETEKLEEGVDSDGDGLTDSEEHALGTDPNDPDSDDNGTPDGQEDNNENGVPDGEEVICNFHGFMLDLGPELREYMNMIGPVLSFETSDHTVTFIADDSTHTCKKYVRMCNRATGVCEDAEEISNVQVAANTISITTDDNHLKLLEIGLDAEGKPTLKSVHKDEAGNILKGEETFGPETIEKLRGTKGVGVYDPETGQWTFYNGFDIPRDPRFKDGMTVAPTYNNSPTIMPGNMMGKPLKTESASAQSLLAELPWSPEGDAPMFLFVAFLLMATLFIRRKSIGKSRRVT